MLLFLKDTVYIRDFREIKTAICNDFLVINMYVFPYGEKHKHDC